jgi:hypothetical protein
MLRRAVIALAMLVAGAGVGWAQFSASPNPVVVDCGDGTTGTAPFQIHNGFSSGKIFSVTQVGTCPGFTVMPTSGSAAGMSDVPATATVSSPTQQACTYELHTNPDVEPAPSFVVRAMSCGAGSGAISGDPPVLAFGTVPDGQTATLPWSFYNFTGLELVNVSYAITPPTGPFQFLPGCPGLYSCGQTFPPGAGVPNGGMVSGLPLVQCVGTPSGSHTGTLTLSANAGSYSDTIDLSCQGSGAQTGPQIDVVSPLPLGAVAVGQMESQSLVIGNVGDAELTVNITKVGAASGDWTVSGCQPCTIGAGSGSAVNVTFAPSAIGDRSIQLSLDTNDIDDDPAIVDATGSGAGAVVTANPDGGFVFDFLDQPVGMTSSPLSVVLTNAGTAAQLVTPTITGDFAVTPSVPTSVSSTLGFAITCTPTTTGLRSGTLRLAVPGNLGPQMFDYALSCTGITATLGVSPSPVAFGPVRAGQTETIAVTIHNPGAGMVSVGPMSLDDTSHGLSLAAGPGVGAPTMIGPGGDLVVTVQFQPTAADEGPRSAQLLGIEPGREVAVSGTGTVPRVLAAPAVYDFNTVCVGDAVDHDFTLAVMPSADVVVSSATITGDARFAPAFVEPLGYPSTLAPSMTATVNVHTVAALGAMDAILVWTTDSPDAAMIEVPIHLVGIADGLAASPGELAFGVVAVGEPSGTMYPSVKSCSPAPVVVHAEITGDPDGAFALSGPPSSLVGDVATTPWGITFIPPDRGEYRATLRLTPATGTPVDIRLVGGEPIAGDTTNYYACGCDAPMTPGGAALVVVVALALGLGRDRRVTARRRS